MSPMEILKRRTYEVGHQLSLKEWNSFPGVPKPQAFIYDYGPFDEAAEAAWWSVEAGWKPPELEPVEPELAEPESELEPTESEPVAGPEPVEFEPEPPRADMPEAWKPENCGQRYSDEQIFRAFQRCLKEKRRFPHRCEFKEYGLPSKNTLLGRLGDREYWVSWYLEKMEEFKD